MWLYHSHTNEARDVASGLIGAIVVTRRGMADADASRKMSIANSCACSPTLTRTRAWYLEHNIQTFTSDPKGINKTEFLPVDGEGDA